MKVLIIHRNYRHKGGEDFFLENSLLPELRKLQIPYHLEAMPALFSQNQIESLIETMMMTLGLEHLRPSYFKVKKLIRENQFTHVLFNNFIPTISLKAPALCKSHGLKTMAWIHNSRLNCANGLNFNGTKSCQKCIDVGSVASLVQNCQGSWAKSLMYSLVYRFRRVSKIVANSIDIFISPSHYTESKITQSSAASNKFRVIHHPIPEIKSVPTPSFESLVKALPQPWFLFLGRLSFEKGADLFSALAKKYPQRGFVMAGQGPMMEQIKSSAPPNLLILGQAGEEQKAWLYAHAEALVISSRVPENAPLTIFESHGYGLPVIYPTQGGAEEMVRYLNRNGCSLNEFANETTTKSFVRSQGTAQISHQNDFARELKSLFS